MNLVTFLGTGQYHETTYFWEAKNKECRTSLFPVAAVELFEPEEVTFLITQEAKNTDNYQRCRDLIERPVQEIQIPHPEREKDFWDLFEILTTNIPKSRPLLLDVTHAFRSLPLIAFTVVLFLERIEDLPVHRILYGNYEAETDGRSPIIDLTPLTDLMNWIYAVNAFERTGNGRDMGQFLKNTHKSVWQSSDGKNGPRHLQTMGRRMQQLSESLDLTRPESIRNRAHDLLTKLNEHSAEVKQWAKPFSRVLDVLEKTLRPLSYDPEETALSKSLIRYQLDLVHFYEQKNQPVQAITLAREWMINWGLYLYYRYEGSDPPFENWLQEEQRQLVNDELNRADRYVSGRSQEAPTWFNAIPDWRDKIKIWGTLTEVRNDLAHCGMQVNPSSASRIRSKIGDLLERLDELFKCLDSEEAW